MPRPESLSSLDNPRVKALVRLREQKERRKTGLFIAQGQREVGRALAAGLRVLEIFACPPMLAGRSVAQLEDLLPGLAGRGVKSFDVTEPLLRKMSQLENPEGLLAVFEQPRWSLEQVLGGGGTPADSLVLVAVGLAKPGNLGAIVRSADAAGAAGVLVADAVVDAFNPNAIRASTGAVFALPVVGGSSDEILAALRQARLPIYAATPDAPLPYTQANLAGAAAIVIGAEDTGLDSRWLAAAQQRGACMAVPMRGRVVDSLNASVTAGVLLFEALRQRTSTAKPPTR